jgi:hypothetical protein
MRVVTMIVRLYRSWDRAQSNAALRAPVFPSMGERWRAMRGFT